MHRECGSSLTGCLVNFSVYDSVCLQHTSLTSLMCVIVYVTFQSPLSYLWVHQFCYCCFKCVIWNSLSLFATAPPNTKASPVLRCLSTLRHLKTGDATLPHFLQDFNRKSTGQGTFCAGKMQLRWTKHCKQNKVYQSLWVLANLLS